MSSLWVRNAAAVGALNSFTERSGFKAGALLQQETCRETARNTIYESEELLYKLPFY
jgi:hypothetical protein